MNRLFVACLICSCLAYAPATMAANGPKNDVPGKEGSTGNPYKGQQGCWTIPIWENGSALTYKNPGDMLQNEGGLPAGKTPKQLADEYPDNDANVRYFANVGYMIDQQCGSDAITHN